MTTETKKEKWHKYYIAPTITGVVSGLLVYFLTLIFQIAPLKSDIQDQSMTIGNLRSEITTIYEQNKTIIQNFTQSTQQDAGGHIINYGGDIKAETIIGVKEENHNNVRCPHCNRRIR